MKLTRGMPKAETMRTLIVAAGGFSVGGLLMAGGLTFHSAQVQQDRVNLQDQTSSDPSTPPPPVATQPPAALAAAPKATKTSKPRVTTAARARTHTVYRPAAPVVPQQQTYVPQQAYVPPPVVSSGS